MKKFETEIMVTRSFLPPIEEYMGYLQNIWKSHWLTNNGKIHNELQDRLSSYLGTKHTTLFTNGHLALEAAIECLNLKGEIITTPYTFVSTTNAIIRKGCTPVMCDIKESDLTIDETMLEHLITEKTSAIIPVHVYGHPCNVEAISGIAKKYNLKVIYDAAHAFGVKIRGKGIMEFGDISMLSFHATKLFNTIEGGALAYNNNYQVKLNQLKNFGITDEEHAEYIGGNAKMNEFQAAMGLANIKYVDQLIRERKEITNRYRKRLSQISGIRFFEADKDPSIQYNYAYFPVLIDEKAFGSGRDELHSALKKYNIFTRKYFYPLTCDFESCKKYIQIANVEKARRVSESILTLPIYNGLKLEMVDYIVDCIEEIQCEKRHGEKRI